MRTTLSWASLSAVLLGACLLACGGQTTGPGGGTGSLSGTVSGTTFQVASQVGIISAASSSSTCGGSPDGGVTCVNTNSGQLVGVVLTNRADATCAYIQSEAETNGNTSFANFDALLLAVVDANGQVTPGTYAIQPVQSGATSGAGAQFETSNDSCVSGVAATATSGTITLTAAGPDEIAGSYSVTFGAQGTFSGTFDVQTCALPDAGPTTSSGAGPIDAGPVCKP